MQRFSLSPETIQNAIIRLREGGLIVFPTDTLYGIGADAENAEAVAKVYEHKHRPLHKALSILVSDIDMASRYGDVTPLATELASRFWPGALTLLIPKHASSLADTVAPGKPAIAVRQPAHKAVLEMIRGLGRGMVGPSANLSGEAPSSAPELIADYDDVFAIVDGFCPIGIESTLVDCTGDVPKVLRLGAISVAMLESGSGMKFDVAPQAHAPDWRAKTPLRLNAVDVKDGEALLAFGSLKYMAAEGIGFAKDLPPSRLQNLSEAGDEEEALRRLYVCLARLEKYAPKSIAVMALPSGRLSERFHVEY